MLKRDDSQSGIHVCVSVCVTTAAGLCWVGSEDAKYHVVKLRNLSAIIVLQRDEGEGTVKEDPTNPFSPTVHYRVCVSMSAYGDREVSGAVADLKQGQGEHDRRTHQSCGSVCRWRRTACDHSSQHSH